MLSWLKILFCIALQSLTFDFSAAPNPPQDVTVIGVTDMSVTISWSTPESNNAPILGYRIRYYLPIFSDEDVTFGQAMIVNVTGLETQETVMSLRPFVNYTFTVVAFNEIGDSEQSNPVSVLTNESGWLILSIILHIPLVVVVAVIHCICSHNYTSF